MERQYVTSSNLRSVGYSAEERILEIEFVNGTLYEYYEVPESEYQYLIQASSCGRYFNMNIRDSYEHNQLR
ncbi:MAG: KTSC domain-containing protein [Hymenobacter sp.]|nr:MAG: KTSC domain-containing protein [Hymenobacter sp.]